MHCVRHSQSNFLIAFLVHINTVIQIVFLKCKTECDLQGRSNFHVHLLLQLTECEALSGFNISWTFLVLVEINS